MKHVRRLVLVLLPISVLMWGCSAPTSLLEKKRIDYKSAGQNQPLEVPPD